MRNEIRDVKRHFFITDNPLIDDYGRRIGPYGIALYVALKRFAGAKDECHPSCKRLAEVTGMSRRMISKTLKVLVQEGLIQITPRYAEDGHQSSNLIEFNDVQKDAPLHVVHTPPAPRACLEEYSLEEDKDSAATSIDVSGAHDPPLAADGHVEEENFAYAQFSSHSGTKTQICAQEEENVPRPMSEKQQKGYETTLLVKAYCDARSKRKGQEQKPTKPFASGKERGLLRHLREKLQGDMQKTTDFIERAVASWDSLKSTEWLRREGAQPTIERLYSLFDDLYTEIYYGTNQGNSQPSQRKTEYLF